MSKPFKPMVELITLQKNNIIADSTCSGCYEAFICDDCYCGFVVCQTFDGANPETCKPTYFPD